MKSLFKKAIIAIDSALELLPFVQKKKDYTCKECGKVKHRDLFDVYHKICTSCSDKPFVEALQKIKSNL